MKAIQKHFSGRKATDAELEMLAQTWSEHCQHKIFNGKITYNDTETGETEIINSLFDTYVKKSTEEIGDERLLSVFKDNAGVVKFNDRICLVYKIETHNSPSALDPFGGAMTGIVGVMRDPSGTGRGAKLLFDVFGYCLGNPFDKKAISPKLLHPRRIRDGVHKGVIDGSNQSGYPLTRGWEIFDKRYAGKPLVYCGTLGFLPLEAAGRLSHTKEADPGDFIVMVGGKVGKDGIHGATFSSVELSDESPVQAVQIGDPITQKKMADFLLKARDLGYIKCITDNGAGGLSSSVGETAKLSHGCEVELENVPLKYEGMDWWEIWISEAQERMTVGVDPKHKDDFLALAKKRGVEATVIGKYTDSGRCVVKGAGKTIVDIDLDFLHNGFPQYELTAIWTPKEYKEPDILPAGTNMTSHLIAMLGRLNICSKEKKARQYDHEVKGLSVIKPFVGKFSDVPSDATVSFVEYSSKEGVIMTEGINPFYSDIDTYWMAASVIDLAVRRVIAVGGKRKDILGALDNFCWPRSIPDDFKTYTDEQIADFQYKLAQLVKANKALYDFTKMYRTPLISGKDSMFNDCTKVNPLISIPPTLLFSLIAKMPDASKAVTMDVKQPGDAVYVLGLTLNEMGGSEFYRYLGERFWGQGFVGNDVPNVHPESAIRLYDALSLATEKGLVHSLHTPEIGGLGVALAKTAFAGDYGIEADLSALPRIGDVGEQHHVSLFSESNSRFAATVPKKNTAEFEKIMKGNPYARIGVVKQGKEFAVSYGRDAVIESDINTLKKAWQAALRDI
jgi:phosphoribosylformylglycinamidine synthase